MPDPAPQQPIAELRSVSKSYRMDAVDVPVLREVDLLIRPGRFTVLMGPSGSGKTTLLNLLGCLDRPDQGVVQVDGCDLATLSDDQLADFRSRSVGFVFQNFNLIPALTAFENIEYPLALAGMEPARRRRRVTKLLKAVGLGDRAANLPGQLSGGQRQRVAIARALARKPRLVIADEPTANLDSVTGAAILRLMRTMQARYQISFVFASHDPSLMESADDLILLRDGRIQRIVRKPGPAPTEPGATAAPDPALPSVTAVTDEVGDTPRHEPPHPDTAAGRAAEAEERPLTGLV